MGCEVRLRSCDRSTGSEFVVVLNFICIRSAVFTIGSYANPVNTVAVFLLLGCILFSNAWLVDPDKAASEAWECAVGSACRLRSC